MKDRTFTEKGPMSVIALLENFKTARDASEFHDGAATLQFKQCLTEPAEASAESLIALPHCRYSECNGALQIYSKVF